MFVFVRYLETTVLLMAVMEEHGTFFLMFVFHRRFQNRLRIVFFRLGGTRVHFITVRYILWDGSIQRCDILASQVYYRVWFKQPPRVIVVVGIAHLSPRVVLSTGWYPKNPDEK